MVAAPGLERLVTIGPPRRPAHFDFLFLFRNAEPEMETRIARGLIAAPAKPRSHLAAVATMDRDDGAYRVAVRGGPFELEGQRSALLRAIVEVDQRLILHEDHGVEAAIVVEVAHRQPASDVERLERRAGLARHVAKAPRRIADQ